MGHLQKSLGAAGLFLRRFPASASAVPHTPLHPVPLAGPGLRNSVVFPRLPCLLAGRDGVCPHATPQDREVKIPPLHSRDVW